MKVMTKMTGTETSKSDKNVYFKNCFYVKNRTEPLSSLTVLPVIRRKYARTGRMVRRQFDIDLNFTI